MTVAGIATFAVNNISDLNSGDVNFGDFERARDWALDNFIHAVYPWAVAGIVSYSPDNSKIVYSEPICLPVPLVRTDVLTTFVTG